MFEVGCFENVNLPSNKRSIADDCSIPHSSANLHIYSVANAPLCALSGWDIYSMVNAPPCAVSDSGLPRTYKTTLSILCLKILSPGAALSGKVSVEPTFQIFQEPDVHAGFLLLREINWSWTLSFFFCFVCLLAFWFNL